MEETRCAEDSRRHPKTSRSALEKSKRHERQIRHRARIRRRGRTVALHASAPAPASRAFVVPTGRLYRRANAGRKGRIGCSVSGIERGHGCSASTGGHGSRESQQGPQRCRRSPHHHEAADGPATSSSDGGLNYQPSKRQSCYLRLGGGDSRAGVPSYQHGLNPAAYRPKSGLAAKWILFEARRYAPPRKSGLECVCTSITPCPRRPAPPPAANFFG